MRATIASFPPRGPDRGAAAPDRQGVTRPVHRTGASGPCALFRTCVFSASTPDFEKETAHEAPAQHAPTPGFPPAEPSRRQDEAGHERSHRRLRPALVLLEDRRPLAVITLASFSGGDSPFDPDSLIVDGQGNFFGTTEAPWAPCSRSPPDRPASKLWPHSTEPTAMDRTASSRTARATCSARRSPEEMITGARFSKSPRPGIEHDQRHPLVRQRDHWGESRMPDHQRSGRSVRHMPERSVHRGLGASIRRNRLLLGGRMGYGF